MRFNSYKYYRTPNYYHEMDPKTLVFHKALHRAIYSNGWGTDICWSGDVDNHIRTQVVIDKSGKISVSFLSRYKNEKALVKLSNIQKSLEELLEFLSVCYDFGYLIPEGGEEDAAD